MISRLLSLQLSVSYADKPPQSAVKAICGLFSARLLKLELDKGCP